MKNLLKFMSIGLALVVVLFSQMTMSNDVEAADVSENDIEFMTQHETAVSTVEKFYKAGSSNTEVAVFVRDADLNKTVSGQTSWHACTGRIAALDGITATVAGRNPTAGNLTYVVDSGDITVTRSGTVITTATDLILTAVVANNGAVTVATNTTGILAPGCGFADDDVLTISNAALGGYAGVADLTAVVNGLTAVPADNAGKDVAFESVWSLDFDIAHETANSLESTAANAAIGYAVINKIEDSDGNAGRADSVAEKTATPHQYLGAKTSLVLNSLSVKHAGVTLGLNSVNENAGTFKVNADVDDINANAVIATYSFNAQQKYSSSDTGSKRVHITSTSDSTGEWIEIAEVLDEGANDATIGYNAGAANGNDDGAIDSSIFRGVVNINTDASAGAANNSAVWVQDGDTLTASYYEVKASDGTTGALIKSTTATIDATAPSISGITPADGTLTSDKTPNLEFTIEDGGSGFDSSITKFSDHVSVTVNGCAIPSSALGVKSHSSSSITIIYNAAVDWTTNAKQSNGTDVHATLDCKNGGAAARASGGFNVNGTSGPAANGTSNTIHGTKFTWYILATDDAGNTKSAGLDLHHTGAISASTLDLRIDATAPSATAVTGAKAWSSGDKKTVDDNSSVQITFNESLDASTVTASDFTVSGVGVTSSTIETVTMGGSNATADTMVFLDLSADLGPNAKPKVKLVGEVQDRAGNKLKPATTETTGKTLGTSTDGVKPTLTSGALTSQLMVKDGEADITFVSNENLTKTGEAFGAPRGTYGSLAGGGTSIAMDSTDAGNVAITLSSPKSAKGTVKHGTAEEAIPMNLTGIYGITAIGRDAADNIGVGGAIKVTEDISACFVGAALADNAGANDTKACKVKNWPIADHDGDGSLQDSVTAITIDGSAHAAMSYVDANPGATGGTQGGFRYESTGDNPANITVADGVSMWVSNIDYRDDGDNAAGEKLTFTFLDAANITIAADSTVKITYYYVDPAQVFELDLDAPTVTFSPANLATTVDKTPSVSFAWDDNEYAGDTNTTVTMTKATLTNPDDSVTDILGDISTTDNKTFYYVPTEDLDNGEYKLTVTAEDSGGNEKKDQTSKFTIKDRTKTTIAMEPGWNLVSIPAEASDSDINVVIDNSQVETVLTYDPGTPGGWLTAVRDGDSLVGTLSTIDASHGYWIFQKNGDDIKVDLPGYKGGSATTPPAISVVEGWNLVPTVTLTVGEATVASTVDADNYLLGIDWVKAKGWNATTEAWVEVLRDVAASPNLAGGGNNLSIGKGYWIFSKGKGTIVP